MYIYFEEGATPSDATPNEKKNNKYIPYIIQN